MNSTNAKQRRQFYLILSVFFLALGFWKLYRGKPLAPYVCFISSVLFVLLEFVFKALGRVVFEVWMKFAHLLGTINTTILLTVIYFVVLTPIGMIKKRTLNKSPYSPQSCRQRKSAWFDLPISTPTDRYSSSY